MSTIIVSQKSSFSDILEKRGISVLVDPIAVSALMNSFPFSPGSLQVAKYHFLDSLLRKTHPTSGAVYFTARAACLKPTEQGIYAYVSSFNISNLISSYSSLFMDGHTNKGNSLYERIGSIEKSKEHYITRHLMNKTIEGIASHGPNALTWKFIESQDFLDFPTTYSASSDFLEYMNNQYIELVNEIKAEHHVGESEDEELTENDLIFFKEQQNKEFLEHLIEEGPGARDEFLGDEGDEQFEEGMDEDEYEL